MPEVGVEPTLTEANTALNRARLPIPPLRRAGREGGEIIIFEVGGRKLNTDLLLSPPNPQSLGPK